MVGQLIMDPPDPERCFIGTIGSLDHQVLFSSKQVQPQDFSVKAGLLIGHDILHEFCKTRRGSICLIGV